MKCHILAVLQKDKTLGREKKGLQPQARPKPRFGRKPAPLGMISMIYFFGGYR